MDTQYIYFYGYTDVGHTSGSLMRIDLKLARHSMLHVSLVYTSSTNVDLTN